MDHLSRDRGTLGTQLWADFRAICIFGIPEITRLGSWLMEVLNINTFLSLPPPSEESRTLVQLAPQQRSELELSKVLIAQAKSPRGHITLQISLEAHPDHVEYLSLPPFLCQGGIPGGFEGKKMLLRLPRLMWEDWPKDLSKPENVKMMHPRDAWRSLTQNALLLGSSHP